MLISNQRIKSKAIFVLSEEDRPGKEKWVGGKKSALMPMLEHHKYKLPYSDFWMDSDFWWIFCGL